MTMQLDFIRFVVPDVLILFDSDCSSFYLCIILRCFHTVWSNICFIASAIEEVSQNLFADSILWATKLQITNMFCLRSLKPIATTNLYFFHIWENGYPFITGSHRHLERLIAQDILIKHLQVEVYGAVHAGFPLLKKLNASNCLKRILSGLEGNKFISKCKEVTKDIRVFGRKIAITIILRTGERAL